MRPLATRRRTSGVDAEDFLEFRRAWRRMTGLLLSYRIMAGTVSARRRCLWK